MDNIILYTLLIAALAFGLTMLTLIDIIKKDFGSIKTKALWHFVALIPFLGWLIYLVFGSRKGQKKPI
ncbi:MAG: hypothetical protein GY710_18990 [Desulfobacteraceae bacterium]|nr:hypothetical protein [Desulfobacteraceae bacterium]